MTARYAIYFSPRQYSPWWEFGARWLGREEFDGEHLARVESMQIASDELSAITSEPRRYGFHATLKAPFCLSNRHTVDDLLIRIQALAVNLRPLALGPLQVLSLGKFVALVPTKPSAELMALAETCVVSLDGLRAALSPEDLARRGIGHLDARGLELLHCYGYPYVLERFRFHMTLTGPVDQPTRQKVIQAVAEQVTRLNAVAPLVLDRLCLFRESVPGKSFRRIADVALSS